MVRHNFPDFIEWWNRDNFRKVGYGLVAASAVAAAGGAVAAVTSTTLSISSVAPAVILGSLTAGYWHVGLEDMRQTSHAIRRNYPVLGNVRYILETVRRFLWMYCVAFSLASIGFPPSLTLLFA
jgi:hypothetical protein